MAQGVMTPLSEFSLRKAFGMPKRCDRPDSFYQLGRIPGLPVSRSVTDMPRYHDNNRSKYREQPCSEPRRRSPACEAHDRRRAKVLS